ncbi:MAG TPA: PilX N-terminal domain-containing pilus assembly protein [Hydrogenophaga sp.]|uniref:pilus assembly PilX family protein n=1 Tax=Hydrogenophaga sp. TaxID=1904254 RepID=UPI002D1636BE|nr:PilX N-terminal domain-containing pilus assembly protein [Hydrogenophaga sp.]HMN93007.1 PilX N-terminal domain-containing pilus assembly protein [Hydrogenophaga sp.]HMP10773.1 PilX N-terminal domain-containing pilus assembly protein [Hydrogenophaga sp.]
MTRSFSVPPRLPARVMGRAPGLRRQSGAVLVIGLIILVVLTLLGVQGMRTNVAQERMASNMRERNLAFQAAEAALRQGERANPNDHDPNPLPDPVNWDGVAALGGGAVGGFTQDLPNPTFHMGPPERIRVGLTLPPEWRLIYPVTARGVGFQDGSVVIIQSGVEPVN